MIYKPGTIVCGVVQHNVRQTQQPILVARNLQDLLDLLRSSNLSKVATKDAWVVLELISD